VNHPETECFEQGRVRRWLHDLFSSDALCVFQNAPFDVGWLSTSGWDLRPPKRIADTTAAAFMVDENRTSYALDDLCAWRGLPGKDEVLLREWAAAHGWHGDAVKENLWRAPAKYVGPYGEHDPVQTLLLHESLMPEIEAQGMTDAFQLECDLIPLVHEMRKRGVRVNVAYAEKQRDELRLRAQKALKELSDLLGEKVSIDDVRSVGWLFSRHDAANIRVPRLPPPPFGSGAPSFEASWMRKHAHPLPRLCSRAKQLTEAADKFLQGFILDFAHRGRLHPEINQFRREEGGTRSHRFSYAAPPLQQMPHRDEELSALIRGAFEPEEGEVWAEPDYSQQEYRHIVHFANILGLRGAARAARQYADDPDTDFHSYVKEITGLERKPAKDANFGKAFGAGVDKFASMIGRTREEAKEIYDRYDRELPFVKELAEFCDKRAARRGWIRLLDGARSHFDLWEPAWRERGEHVGPALRLEAAKERWPSRRLRRAFTRKAGNRLIQGSAARHTKIAMRECWRAGIVPLLQMHDGLPASVSSEAKGEELRTIMRDAVELSVPMAVDIEFGPTWGLARATKDYDASWGAAVALGRSVAYRRGRR
jgi:DNA polymerase-1